MPAAKQQVNQKSRLDKILWILVILFIIMFTAMTITALTLDAQLKVQQDSLKITNVENVFVDIDGNGHPDLLLKGEVIFNDGSVNFTASQPKK